ncbi:MAG: gamma-glutamylcyclotransferase [Mesorhizobium sp.]|nr:gamma-glutamylcyclotransferase [Mesorhizobium sp. M6A.T.Cr.TU.016.01.1.1]RUU26904.1 gamma-glutamylcyclotransferase [Mesorhizobium sp. M6A.T.Ce.TU.016.01.1.1]RUU44889.1 gamma-glutamylcyclotransferase [Mesorhizobium sp. M6A.T.Ce.TU.002.03.1.1]RWO98681.1 MAG: gamma-glutamylcyclotransferase [Mesorhizobium sp.]RWP49337.1 MAG: gamma-glutamylcyclotransferase [Mesorhizobium sp.]
MPRLVRKMALTPEIVARVHRVLEDPGSAPGLVYYTEEDYDAAVHETLASHPRGEDLWLFAYGSLIWKPEVEHTEERIGTAHGWHRSFCLKMTRWRGTREQPGLMMALDRGGQCRGMLYRLAGNTVEWQLGKLVRREMKAKPPSNPPRWLTVKTHQGPVRALAFVMNRESGAYTGKLPPDEVADIVAKACGHLGSCAEYLYNTISHLEERGIRDSNLWRLQRLVAERILGSIVTPISS